MTAPPEVRPLTTNRWRPMRRLLVGAFAASTGLLLVSGFLELETPGWAFNVVTFAGALLSPITAMAVIVLVRFVPSQPDDKLDERLRMVRDRAHRTAYLVVSAATLSLLAALQTRAYFSDWLPNTDGIGRWLIATTMLVIATPAAVMAWTEPELEP